MMECKRGIHHKSSISLLLIKAAEWAQVFSTCRHFYSYVLMISGKTNKGVCIGLKRCPAGEKNAPPEELTQANTHKLMLKWELLNLRQLLYTEGSKVVFHFCVNPINSPVFTGSSKSSHTWTQTTETQNAYFPLNRITSGLLRSC